jgi:hypothetical protein
MMAKALTASQLSAMTFTKEQLAALKLFVQQHNDEIDRQAALADAEAEYWEMLNENGGGSRGGSR